MDLLIFRALREHLVPDMIRYINDIQSKVVVKHINKVRHVKGYDNLYFSSKLKLVKLAPEKKTIKCQVTRC